MDLLKYRPFPNLAAAIQARRDSLLKRCRDVLGASPPPGGPAAAAQFGDLLRDVIERLAVALQSDNPPQFGVQPSLRRDDQDQLLSPADLLAAFSVLRPILVEEIAAQIG